MKWLICLILLCGAAFAQPGSRQFNYVAADPSGACSNGTPNQQNYLNGKQWACENSVWTQINTGGGGGGCPAGSSGQIQYYVSAGVCGASALLTFDPLIGHDGRFQSGGVSYEPFGGASPIDLTFVNAAITGIITGTSNDQRKGLLVNITLDPPAGIVGSVQAATIGISTSAADSHDNPGFIYANESVANHNGSGELSYVAAHFGDVENLNTGKIDDAFAFDAYLGNSGMGRVDRFWGFHVFMEAGENVGEAYSFYSNDLSSVATNPYYSWFDSRGVGRCKEDNAFDSVGQSICAVYNPQFTKYTPGAANYERIVYGQFSANVAQVGTEAGGTGTLRQVQMIGNGWILTPYAFAALGSLTNGTQKYCTDCTVTSGIDNTCAASGSGAMAERINGAWKCSL